MTTFAHQNHNPMKKLILSLSLAVATLMPASATEFFSTADTETIFDLGVRVGVNTSNRTISESVASIWNHNSWGIGFDAGVVCDINFKDFISIQPGFFYETRSGAFAYQSTDYTLTGDSYVKSQVGKGIEYLFTIPVVASFHFNIEDNLRWNVDFGPYVQFKLKSKFDHKFSYPEASPYGGLEYYNNVKTSKCDVGLKMGTGIDLYQHYYVGVHYLAGLLNPWNPSRLGGHNKEWMFTIGYTF